MPFRHLKKFSIPAIFVSGRGPISESKRTFPVPFDEKLRKKKKYKKLKKDHVEKILSIAPLFNTSIPTSAARDNFYLLCKDGQVAGRAPELDSKLRCRFQDHGDPFLRLSPFKLEEMNSDPVVFVFHEIISDNEINQLKSRAAPNLKRSEFGGMTATFKTGSSYHLPLA